MVEEKKNQLIQEIDKRAQQLKKEQQKASAIGAKIKAMESKLLIGGKTILDKTTEQEKDIEMRKREILEQKKREREIAQKLEQEEENALEIKENYSSLQQEVDVKTKKLKKLFAKLQSTKQEIIDTQEHHIKERQGLETSMEDLNRAIKLKNLIIENFVPREDREKVRQRATYEEEEELWSMKPLTNARANQQMAKRPVSAVGNKRPISEYARKAALLGGNPRYKMENIIQIELDMPNRTTRDYEGPTVAPRIQAALDAALQDEDDLTLDASSINTFNTKIKMKGKRGERPKTAKAVGMGNIHHQQRQIAGDKSEEENFPTARGLVKNK